MSVKPVGVAPRYFYPCLPWAQYNNNVGKFLDPEYFKQVRDANGRGQVHPGADINGNGGGDTDLGKPWRAIADGTVTHVQNHRVFGWVITIWHEGPAVESMQAHFDTVDVEVGERVSAGQVIATIGKGGKTKDFPKGRFWAHGHLEIRTVEGIPPDEWPSVSLNKREAEQYIRRTRGDPIRFLEKMNAQKI